MQSGHHEPSDIFECKKCGECCKGFGGTYVTDGDIEAIAAFIHTDVNTFKTKYCQMSGSRPVIAQAENGYCIFWDKICTIHPVKPRMCRAWPFIRSVLVDVDNWYAMADSCPGMKKEVPEEVVRACVETELSRNDTGAI